MEEYQNILEKKIVPRAEIFMIVINGGLYYLGLVKLDLFKVEDEKKKGGWWRNSELSTNFTVLLLRDIVAY